MAWAWEWEWDQGDGAACAPKSERISCLVSFLGASPAVVDVVAFTGGAWKSSEKRSFSDDEGTGAGAGAGVEVT